MKTNARRSQKGSALIMVMIMALIGAGMVAGMLILAQSAQEQADLQIVHEEALDIAEIGLNETIHEIRNYVLANKAGWVDANLDSGSPDTRTLTGSIKGVPYTVRVRSAYLAYQSDPQGNAGWLKDVTGTRGDGTSQDYDIYEVVAVTGTRATDGSETGVGNDDYRSGVRAIIELPKMTLGSMIPSPLYIDNDPDPHFAGNAFSLSGEDHEMEPSRESATIKMPYNGTVQIDYEGSTAGLRSGFYLIDPYTGEEICIFEDNLPGASYPTDNREFTQEQCLNFFARTAGSAWGIGDYDHYTEDTDPYSGKPWAKKFVLDPDGKTYLTDGTTAYTHMVDGDQNIYDDNGNVVEPILVDINTPLTDYAYTNADGKTVVTVRLGIEDLPGRYKKWGTGSWKEPDWDYDDVVVKLNIVQTICDTCGGSGFLSCDKCNGTGLKNNGDPCNHCNGVGREDCPDCNVEEYVEQPWWEQPEENCLTGNPGTEALGINPTPVDAAGVHNDDDALNTRTRTLEEEWDATGISDNQVDQVRCDGKDEDGNHLGFDRDAVDAGTMQLSERSTAEGFDSFTHSSLDLRQMAADIVGGTRDLLPGETNPETGEVGGGLKDGVLTYDRIGNGQNHNDIGTKANMKVTYINGDAGTLAGQVEGGGVLIINGDAHISGKWAFAGIVIVLGDLQVTGGGNGLHALGAVLVGGEVKVAGNADIWWSREAVDRAAEAAGNPCSYKVRKMVWSQLDKGDIDALGY